jgi:hypothetical protein
MNDDTGDTVVSAAAGNLPALTITHHDDPSVIAEAAGDDYALHVVSRTWRLSAPKMALAWSAVMAAMFWIVVAAGASLGRRHPAGPDRARRRGGGARRALLRHVPDRRIHRFDRRAVLPPPVRLPRRRDRHAPTRPDRDVVRRFRGVRVGRRGTGAVRRADPALVRDRHGLRDPACRRRRARLAGEGQRRFHLLPVGIALVFIVVRRRAGQDAFEFRPGRVHGVNPAGIIAWIVSSGVGIYLIASKNPSATTWALVITFVLAVLISAGLLLTSKDKWRALMHRTTHSRFSP